MGLRPNVNMSFSDAGENCRVVWLNLAGDFQFLGNWASLPEHTLVSENLIFVLKAVFVGFIKCLRIFALEQL